MQRSELAGVWHCAAAAVGRCQVEALPRAHGGALQPPPALTERTPSSAGTGRAPWLCTPFPKARPPQDTCLTSLHLVPRILPVLPASGLRILLPSLKWERETCPLSRQLQHRLLQRALPAMPAGPRGRGPHGRHSPRTPIPEHQEQARALRAHGGHLLACTHPHTRHLSILPCGPVCSPAISPT